MAKCVTCGKTFHACSSCGLQDWEWRYCNESCRETSPVLQDPRILEAMRFYSAEQLDQILTFLTDLENDYEPHDLPQHVEGVGEGSALQRLLEEESIELHDLRVWCRLELERLGAREKPLETKPLTRYVLRNQILNPRF